ncbi:transposase [Xenorhabdus sp. ZM]|nr:transposase [Xenorhabdus sp. ZM]
MCIIAYSSGFIGHLCHIQPGRPQQNGFIERFNGSFLREL